MVLFIDLRTAIDTVNLDILLSELEIIVRIYLTSREQHVVNILDESRKRILLLVAADLLIWFILPVNTFNIYIQLFILL